jgi:acyl-CoA synthetase (AMP-forming)/AMP-acid ligase II
MRANIDQILLTQSDTRPDAPAITDTLGIHWSYQQLNNAVEALAEQLRRHSVGPGDRVMLLLENCAPVVATVFACARLQAVIVPINARQTATEIDRVIAHAKPSLILFCSAASKDAAAHAERLGASLISGSFGELALHGGASAPDPELADVATILYTTGTTGTPKGVMLTHQNLLFAGAASVVARELQPTDVSYGVLPVSHVFGLASVLVACCTAGSHIRLATRFSTADLYTALTTGVTVLSAVPQMHAQLMHYTKEQGYDTLPSKTLRYVSSGAAPLDPVWKRKAETFYGVPVQNGYGLTETTAGVCLTRHRHSNDDISVGVPVEGVDIKLDFSAAGAEGDIGEILIRGGGNMKGYYRNPVQTAEVLTADGWFRTGDLGRFDEQHNLHVVGRSKELIIHGGFNVYPPEVEAALNDHPQVIQCAVVGHRVDGDEHVYAFVEADPRDWPAESEIYNFVAERLAGYKRPSRIVIAEKLPAAATGKILKNKLTELLL